METHERPCPQCGANAQVRYRTVSRDGIRTPIDPQLVCVHGHLSPLPIDRLHLREGAAEVRPGETRTDDLIE